MKNKDFNKYFESATVKFMDEFEADQNNVKRRVYLVAMIAKAKVTPYSVITIGLAICAPCDEIDDTHKQATLGFNIAEGRAIDAAYDSIVKGVMKSSDYSIVAIMPNLLLDDEDQFGTDNWESAADELADVVKEHVINNIDKYIVHSSFKKRKKDENENIS